MKKLYRYLLLRIFNTEIYDEPRTIPQQIEVSESTLIELPVQFVARTTIMGFSTEDEITVTYNDKYEKLFSGTEWNIHGSRILLNLRILRIKYKKSS